MTPQEFYANLPKAYASLERMFDSFRECVSKELLDCLESRDITPVKVPASWRPAASTGNESIPNHRATLCLGEGYAAKIRPWQAKGFCYVDFEPIQNIMQSRIEETNVWSLRKHSFTRENGFWVPEHKVVGLHMIDGKIKINRDIYGRGVTITEDLSENGSYKVTDITPEHFASLANTEEFRASHERHVAALLELYNNPRIRASVNRHGAPDNPRESIERMLLARIKDNRGEIVIGDLDNLVFDERADAS